MVKNEMDKEETPLKALIVADCFDRRFLPVLGDSMSWSCIRIANIEILNYILEWLSRTEVRDIILAVTLERESSLQQLVEFWKDCFHSIEIVACQNCLSVCDAIREVQGRSLITSDFVLITNPATFCSFDLQAQIKSFRERRKVKNNVMTLLYTEREGNNPVLCVDKKTNKLVFYHRGDDSSRCDIIDKTVFLGDSVVRSDIQDTGIALCAPAICTQFSDNFDFQHRDDIIREILVNEEILCQNIHVEVIPSNVSAFTIGDYEGLLRANTLILQRWLYPLLPGHIGSAKFVSQRNNVYVALKNHENDHYNLTNPFYAARSFGPNVVLGSDCKIDPSAVIKYSSIGNNCVIGEGAVISHCILGNNVSVKSSARLTRAFIGNDVSIGEKAVVEAKCIITDKVSIEPLRVVGTNSVLCAIGCDAEEDDIVCTPTSSAFEWKFANGSHFWDASSKKRTRSESSMAEKDADKEKVAGEVSVEKELNNVEQFLEEVKESMERIAMESKVSNQLIKNLILEINSSKLAYNISMEDVARNVFISFLSLPQTSALAQLKAMAKKWVLLFSNYYRPVKSQIQALIAMEEHLALSNNFTAMVPNVVHFFYDELEVLEEEAILEWYNTVADDAPIKKLVAPIIDWLNTAEEDESD